MSRGFKHKENCDIDNFVHELFLLLGDNKYMMLRVPTQ